MKRVSRQLTQSLLMLAIVLMCVSTTIAQQNSDNGMFTITGSAAAFVEIRAGGNATLTGNVTGTGGIINNKVKGDRFSINPLTIDLGELGPTNTNAFVTATVPLRLRSNSNYTLTMNVSNFATANPDEIQPSDIGFGMGTADRSDPTVRNGTDTFPANVLGAPTAAGTDADPATPRFDFATGKRLSDYITPATVMSGPTIMRVVPGQGNNDGLVVSSSFAVKPQFFAPGSFTATVTFTITTP